MLSHPNIVTIYQVGEDNRMAYIAMEFVRGTTLEKLMTEAPPSAEIIRRILTQVADALDFAHHSGVVHRDVKPANIMLNDQGVVKICDFGIAKIFGAQTALTATGMTVGSPYYMSPEQVEGEALSHHSDQYSLAVVAYELLSGQVPFRAESLATLFRKILLEPPPAIHESNGSLGQGVSAVLNRALSKDPTSRYGSCGQFVEALLKACEEQSGWRPAPRRQIVVEESLADQEPGPQPSISKKQPKDAESGRCPACGRVLKIESKLCSFCGSPLIISEPAKASTGFGSGAVRRSPLSAGTISDASGTGGAVAFEPSLSPVKLERGEPIPMMPPTRRQPISAFRDVSHQPAHRPRLRLLGGIVERRVPPLLVTGLIVVIGAGVFYFFSGMRPVAPNGRAGSEGRPAVLRTPAERPNVPDPAPSRPKRAPSTPFIASNPHREPKPEPVPTSAPAASTPPAPWPTFRGNAQRTGLADVRGPRQPEILWTIDLGGQPSGSPVIGARGIVYILASDRKLYAIGNGRILWTAAVGEAIDATPSIGGNGRLRIRVSSGRSLSFSSDGEAAQDAIADAMTTEATAESLDGRVYYVDGRILRLLGDSHWRVDLGDTGSTYPAVDRSGNVYVGTAGGTLVCVNDRGKIRWTYRVPNRVTSSPAIQADGDVIFGCADRNLYCLRNGELRWKYSTRGAIYSSPIIDRAGIIYFGSNDGVLYAIDDTGEEVWKLDLQNEIRSSPAIDSNGWIYVASVARRLYCIGDNRER